MKTRRLNPEQLILQAGEIVADFVRHHNEICVLGILNGVVVARAKGELPKEFIEVQKLTRWQCENGLTSEQWNALGDRLYFNLYNEDPKK